MCGSHGRDMTPLLTPETDSSRCRCCGRPSLSGEGLDQSGRPGERDTRFKAWRVNASKTGRRAFEVFLAGHPEGTLDKNWYLDAVAPRCTQVIGVSSGCTGSERKSERRQAKDLVGFNTPWRFESSLRHQHPDAQNCTEWVSVPSRRGSSASSASSVVGIGFMAGGCTVMHRAES